jgi:hypothetical protein
MLIPQKWQTYHRDWHMQYGRSIYKAHNSDVFALISLFENDKIFVSSPEGVLEMKITGSDRFQIDLHQASQVYPFSHRRNGLLIKIAIYGPNVVSTAGTEWKFHRKIAVKAFPQKTIELVHSETTKQVIQMMATLQKNSMTSDKIIVDEYSPIVILLNTVCKSRL